MPAPNFFFFIYEENKRKFCFHIAKKMHTKHHQIGQKLWKLWKLFDLMMFGMQFFANLKTKLCLFFSKGVVYKQCFLGSILIPCNIKYFVVSTIEENKQNFGLKLAKTACQKSLNRIIFIVFDRFDDVWYAVLCQFSKQNFCLFSPKVSVAYKQKNPFLIQDRVRLFLKCEKRFHSLYIGRKQCFFLFLPTGSHPVGTRDTLSGGHLLPRETWSARS